MTKSTITPHSAQKVTRLAKFAPWASMKLPKRKSSLIPLFIACHAFLQPEKSGFNFL